MGNVENSAATRKSRASSGPELYMLLCRGMGRRLVMVAFHTRNADRMQGRDMSTMLSMGFYPIWIMHMLSTNGSIALDEWRRQLNHAKGQLGLYE